MSLTALPPTRVPTLTEVVEWSPAFLVEALRVRDEARLPPQAAPLPVIDEAALTGRILADLQGQVDAMLDHHLRVALTPVLQRQAELLAHHARDELASALRDMVARAVSQAMIRQRAARESGDSL